MRIGTIARRLVVGIYLINADNGIADQIVLCAAGSIILLYTPLCAGGRGNNMNQKPINLRE